MSEHTAENDLPHADCDPLRHSVHGRTDASEWCPACQRHARVIPPEGSGDERPTEVQVAFMVPVEVVVNLESRTVTKVIVAAEGVTMPLDEENLPEVHEYATFEEVTDPDIRLKAGDIANHADVEWPAWDYS